MASSRKKQEEKNLKTLRELAALPYNKYCFDCNQRGPTYVNVTIGSFVCTKCSGMLRGLTPPNRVKSISMTTFTTEEIDLLKNRGNDYCKRVWLGLYEGNPPTECRDEQAVRDFMINKYERKRYYLDPAQALRNGYAKPELKSVPETKPLKSLVADLKPLRVNGNLPADNHRKRPESHSNKNNTDFIADFDKADIFSSCSNNNNNSSNGINGIQGGFANFDNNPIFENSTNGGLPPPSMNNMNQHQSTMNKAPLPPREDKYAALKDLDNALKSQAAVDWTSSNGSSNSLYSSPTPTGSMYSSQSSPQSSIFGSPSQGQFMGVFPIQENGVANPFSNGINWQNGSNGMMGAIHHQPYVNPFRNIDASKMNGFTPSFQPAMYPYENVATSTWAANPFKVGGAANMKSNNPFL